MDDFWNQVVFKMGNFELKAYQLISIVFTFLLTWIILLFTKYLLLKKKQLTINEKGRRLSLFQLVKYLLWVLVISYCITVLGFNISLLLAGSAALLVGLGFGLQNIFSDLVSGLFMLFERKVKVGDIMEVDNIVGKVLSIQLRTSVLLTRDGYNIIVPNHKFITDNVINWSHHSFDRRFQVDVGVSYTSDIDLVTQVMIGCSALQKELIRDEKHKPFVRFHDFGDSALIFSLMFWTQDIFKVEQIKSELRYKIFKAFREHNITIPFPQRDVHIIPAK